MTPQLIERLTDVQAVALTMYGEARGEREGGTSVEERIAVGCVIRNRVKTPHKFGTSFKGVCLQRGQFSCWWEFGGLDNYRHMQAVTAAMTGQSGFPVLRKSEADLLMESQFLADGIVGGMLLDSTRGATHYYAPAAMKPIGRIPVWAVGKHQLARIGGHLFYKA